MKMNAQDKKWQRESDAHTLAEAEQIKSSPGRLKGAKTEANRMAKEAENRAKAMKKVAKPTPRKTTRSKAVVQSNTKIPGIKRR